jgi:putative acetyltransferase
MAGERNVDEIIIQAVSAPTEEVRILIGELDQDLSENYLPEQRHGLTLDAIFQPNIHFFLARVGKEAVGCGGVAFFPDFAEVKRMYVREAARRRGVARAMLIRIEKETLDAGLSVLRLETGKSQAAALRLYSRWGFRSCAPFGPYATMPSPSIAASIFLEKRLPIPFNARHDP